MSWIELSTRRRVTVAMVTVTLVLFGLIGLSRLKVNLLPDLSYPTLTVRTEYVGAAPGEIENLITEPVEEALGVVKDVRRLRSISRTGQSDVLLEFGWGTDMDRASIDVRERLELLQLPLEAGRPLLLRFNPATEPILRLGLSRAGADPEALKTLRRFADEELKKRLETRPGVAAVKVSGGLEDEVQVEVDQRRLAQLGIDIGLVIERLRQENVNLAGGRLDEANQRFLVRTLNQFATLAEMADLLIVVRNGVPIRLRDVAEIRSGAKERQAIIRLNGAEAVEIAIYKEGDANTVAVADAVLGQLERLRRLLPAGAELTVVEDQSRFIREAIREVVFAAALGGLLSVLMIYFFLGEAWATLVISVSLPVSIIATFFFMQQFGITLNVMSLGGIALATGMVVDNAIVVLENTQRLRAQGLGVLEAAVQGASEVGMAITASTLTHIAVFLPLVFVEGIAGQLFRDQALTVTFAMLVSLFVAMTLIPMLAALRARRPDAYLETVAALEGELPQPAVRPWWAHQRRDGYGLMIPLRLVGRGLTAVCGALWRLALVALRIGAQALQRMLSGPAAWVMGGYARLEALYRRFLPWALEHPARILAVAAGFGLLALALVPRFGLELIPEFAQGQLNLELKLPPGTPLETTDAIVARIQTEALTVPGVAQVHAVSGSGARLDANPVEAGENIGRLLLQLAPGVSRAREPEVIAGLRRITDVIPGARATFSRPELFSFGVPIEVQLEGRDLERLKQAADQVSAMMRASGRFTDVQSSMEQGAPELRIVFDQEKVAALGLTVKQVADQVVRKVRGEVATRFSVRDRKIDVLVRATDTDRASVESIRRLLINPEGPNPLPLEAVARIEVSLGPAEIRRTDQARVALISAAQSSGDVGSALAFLRQRLAESSLPAGVTATVAGQSDDLDASFRSLLMALALAVFMVYLVMAAQFESLRHPLVILFTVPLALVGAIFALWFTTGVFSIVVFIGLIMLVGIVVSNAIVLIDRVNQLRSAGKARREAVLEAAYTRLRPIVMTTLTTLLGFLPMALGLGEGAEVRAPLAITVIGGLAFSTLLTLVVIPVVYEGMDRLAFSGSGAPAIEPRRSVP